jgi:hypothetical protein
MLLAMLFVAYTVSAGSFLDTTGAIIFINIPLGGDVATRPAPSLGFDVDLPVGRKQRGPWRATAPRFRSVAPLEVELPGRGRYRVKVGGFYLDTLK